MPRLLRLEAIQDSQKVTRSLMASVFKYASYIYFIICLNIPRHLTTRVWKRKLAWVLRTQAKKSCCSKGLECRAHICTLCKVGLSAPAPIKVQGHPSRSRGTTLGTVPRSANVPIFIHAFNSRRRAWAVSFSAGLHQCLTFILGEDTDWPCLCLSIHRNLRYPPQSLLETINNWFPLIRPY